MPVPALPRHATAAVLLCASLVLTGCSGSSGSHQEAGADRGAVAPEAARGPGPAYGPAPAPTGPGGAGAVEPGAVRQHVVRTTELSVEVADADKALARARAVAAGAGGHVADESTRRHRGGGLTSRVTLRVPQAAYEEAVGELAGAGRLLSRRARAQDVTDRVVDVESRIATQRASVARVRELMDRAVRLSDVVELERELGSRQADLESLLAQQKSLKDRTSLATITLELSEPEVREAREGGAPGVVDALRGGWGALLTSLTWFVVVLAALAPWLALSAVGYAVWRRVAGPWRARRRARGPRRDAPAVPAARPAPGAAGADAAAPPGPRAPAAPEEGRGRGPGAGL